MKKQPKIKVELIGYTAADGMAPSRLLVYTKSTRLEQGKRTREKIRKLSEAELDKELDYMANTIPSSWEFIDFTFEIKNVTRAFTHQFVRTRTGSYAQQTMRMLNKKAFTYRVPPRLNAFQVAIYARCMEQIQSVYDKLIATGAAVEDARGVLPTNIHTNIIAKFNLRTLAEMARSRSGQRTQDEYREVLALMLGCIAEKFPWAKRFLFRDTTEHANWLDNAVINLHGAGKLDNDAKVALLKRIDLLRKAAK